MVATFLRLVLPEEALAVSLGDALVTGEFGDPPASAKRALGIGSWRELTAEKLATVGCKSVLGTYRGVDEFAVPSTHQTHRDTLRVAYYYVASATPSSSSSASSQITASSQPWWLWPAWVQSLANQIGVDTAAIDAVATKQSITDRKASRTIDGVKVNSAGRPIHSDGKFMSYAEAQKRGWKAAALSCGMSARIGVE